MQTKEIDRSAIVITGMHRSGTSLTASLCQNAGVDIGKRLMDAHESNPKGFFENLDFYDFHRKILQSQGINDAGYTLQEKIDVEEHYREEAEKIIAENSRSPIWGWKDPRTTLFLDFWADLLPNAFFLLIYRSPWEVVDSLYRRGSDRLFFSHPDLAIKVWSNYNRKILDFYNKFPQRCHLTSIYQVVENTELLIDTINSKFNISLSVPDSKIYDNSLLRTEITNVPGATLINQFFPQALNIYRELEIKANRIDEADGQSWCEEINSSRYRVKAFQNWLSIRNLEKEHKSIQAQIEQTQAQLEQTSAQLEQTKSKYQQTQTQLEQTSAQLEQAKLKQQHTQTQLEQAKLKQQHTQTQLEQTSAQLEQAKLKQQHTQTQLEQTSAQLEQAKLKQQHTQTQLEQTQKEQSRSLEKLINLIEQFDCLVTSMVESNRWKLGNLLYTIYRKILLKPLDPPPQEHQRKLLNNFQTWNCNLHNTHGNSKQYQSAENLVNVIEEFDSLVTSMVESNRWKLGNSLYTIYRKILLKPLDPPPQEHQRRLINNFQTWNRNLRNAHRDSKQYQSVEKLINVIEEFDSLVTSMVESNRWRIGNRFYTIYKKILRKPLDPPPQEHLDKIRIRFKEWKERTGSCLNSSRITPLDSKLKASTEIIHQSSANCQMQLISAQEKRQLAYELMTRPQNLLISVIMPTWNRASVINDAVYSIQAQTYKNWELIIIDDGSEDNSKEVIKKIAASDNRIKHYFIEHQGVSTARNVGLSHAKGEIIAYLDSDNTWDNDYLLLMVNRIIDSGSSCAYCALKIIDKRNSNKISYRKNTFDFTKLLKNNYIDINIFVHKRELYHTLGGFDPELQRWVDWDLILRYVNRHHPATVPVSLCNYYIHKTQLRITDKESQAFKFKVLNKHLIDWSQLAKEAKKRIENHVTIVIPVYNQANLTKACIDSIFAQTKVTNFDVIVVDNASKDNTKEVLTKLKQKYKNVEYIQNYENYNFALGCNMGLAASKGEFITFLNNDTRVLPNWLLALVDAIKEDSNVAMVGSKLLFPDDTLQSGGLVFNEHSKIPYNIYQGAHKDEPFINKRRLFQAVTGACFAMRAKDFIDLKGFDPIYVNGCEDIDLCLRLIRDIGKQVLYNPSSVIYHLEGKTEGRSKAIMYNREKFVESWRNSITIDDRQYYAEDDFIVTEYFKKGIEPHGETAAYYPILKKKTESPCLAKFDSIDASQVFDNQRSKLSNAPSSVLQISSKKPQRILNIGFCSIWHQRGVSYVTKQLAEAIEGPSFRTHIFARWESKKFFNSSSIYHPRVFNAGDDPSSKDMLQWVKSNEIDLMVFMEVHPKDWKRVKALKQAGIKVIAYEHLDILRWEYLNKYATFDYFLASNFYFREALKEIFPNKSLLTIPWGIDPNNIIPNRAVQPNAPIQFLHVAGWGGLNNRKNTDLIIKAFHEARLPNATLKIYTQTPIENYGEECVKIAKENDKLKLQDGTVDNIYVAYQDADMLLFPSKREGLGLPIVEALASGLPVLTSDGYMMKQWLIPEEHGIICPATPIKGRMFLPEMQVDINDLVDKLRKLSKHPEQIAEMKQNVMRDRSIWLWTWQKQTFREQIRLILEKPGYSPSDDLSYLPEQIKEFEQKRLAKLRDLQ
ncbi:MAG: glycosyltransferase [Xenococcaceae cyanobacterium MO_188.B29]|nr:glycosyltransferase [Xenococcaceae cyanobacterium MO_188.B29]